MICSLYRGELLPDPRYDAVRAIVLAAADDAEDMSGGNHTARVLVFDDGKPPRCADRDGLPHVQVCPLLCAHPCLSRGAWSVTLPCCKN